MEMIYLIVIFEIYLMVNRLNSNISSLCGICDICRYTHNIPRIISYVHTRYEITSLVLLKPMITLWHRHAFRMETLGHLWGESIGNRWFRSSCLILRNFSAFLNASLNLFWTNSTVVFPEIGDAMRSLHCPMGNWSDPHKHGRTHISLIIMIM